MNRRLEGRVATINTLIIILLSLFKTPVQDWFVGTLVHWLPFTFGHRWRCWNNSNLFCKTYSKLLLYKPSLESVLFELHDIHWHLPGQTHSEQRPQIFIPKRKSTSIVSSNWQHKFLYFHCKSVKLDVLCIQNKIWTFGEHFQSKELPICT